MLQADTWKFTIGWVYPGAIDRVLGEFYTMTPQDVNVVLYTKLWALQMVHGGKFDPAAFGQQRSEILSSVLELLQYQDADFIAVSGDLIQSAMGPVWDAELRDEISQVAQRPATTAMTAVSDALRALGAESVAVASPFRDDQNEHIRAYLEAAGFRVASLVGVHTTSIRDIASLPPTTPLEVAKRAFEAAEAPEALYLSCPVWRGVSQSIERLEDELGIPVVTMYSPILWKALITVGYQAEITGFGKLLSTLPQPRTSDRRA